MTYKYMNCALEEMWAWSDPCRREEAIQCEDCQTEDDVERYDDAILCSACHERREDKRLEELIKRYQEKGGQ